MPSICGQMSFAVSLLVIVSQFCINVISGQMNETSNQLNASSYSQSSDTNLTFVLSIDKEDRKDGEDIAEPLDPSDSMDSIGDLNWLWIMALVLLLTLLFLLWLRIRSLRKVPIVDNEVPVNGRTVIDTTGFQEVSLHSLHSIPEAVEDYSHVYSTQASHRWPSGQVCLATQAKNFIHELPPSYEVAITEKWMLLGVVLVSLHKVNW